MGSPDACHVRVITRIRLFEPLKGVLGAFVRGSIGALMIRTGFGGIYRKLYSKEP